jgi:hypothetical protein
MDRDRRFMAQARMWTTPKHRDSPSGNDTELRQLEAHAVDPFTDRAQHPIADPTLRPCTRCTERTKLMRSDDVVAHSGVLDDPSKGGHRGADYEL